MRNVNIYNTWSTKKKSRAMHGLISDLLKAHRRVKSGWLLRLSSIKLSSIYIRSIAEYSLALLHCDKCEKVAITVPASSSPYNVISVKMVIIVSTHPSSFHTSISLRNEFITLIRKYISTCAIQSFI